MQNTGCHARDYRHSFPLYGRSSRSAMEFCPLGENLIRQEFTTLKFPLIKPQIKIPPKQSWLECNRRISLNAIYSLFFPP